MSAYKKSIWTALVLFFLDAFVFSQGLIALITVLVILFNFFPKAVTGLIRKDKEKMKLNLIKSAIYGLMIVAIFTAIGINNTIAHERVAALAQSCQAYKNKYNKYPEKLSDLVPEFIPRVPVAKYTLMFNDFRYISGADRHSIMFVALPPFGRPYYVLEKNEWGFLD